MRQGLSLLANPDSLAVAATCYSREQKRKGNCCNARGNKSVTDKLVQMLPPDGVKILLTLFLCFLIGLEREERRAAGQRYSFGGVRTFPLIGLIGYAMALLSEGQLVPLTAGFAVIGSFLWLSYRPKLESYNEAGVAPEIFTFTKFLLLTFVILPIVPDRDYGPFGVNPFKAWLIVVAISGVSYGSYLLEKAAKGKGGVRLAALLGGAYSSTFTKFVMARRSREAKSPHCYSGAILVASGVMYFRFLALIAFFNMELMRRLLFPFLILGVIGVAGGWAWSSLPEGGEKGADAAYITKNPLELASAFSLAVLFVAMLVAMNFALVHLGRGGIYGLAVLSGAAEMDQ